MKTIHDLRTHLQSLHARTAETPLFNPVFQLGHDLSRQLESGTLSLDAIDGLVDDLFQEALESRGRALHRLIAPVTPDQNKAAWQAVLDQAPDDFGAFDAQFGQPLLNLVFTGHPTFLLTADESDAVAASASADGRQVTSRVRKGPRPSITLDEEHAQAMAALSRARQARDKIVGWIIGHAARSWPDRWTQLLPQPFQMASWVGYDMDGRTDISWATSLRYRLLEKAERLAGYGADLEAIDASHLLRAPLRRAETHSRQMAAGFDGDLSDPETLSRAANQLTADHPDKLLSLGAMVRALQDEAQAVAASQADRAQRLLTLAAAMQADGLGMGWVHFRINAAQLHNAVRRRMDPDNTLDLASGTALKRIRALLADVQPLRSNFAALATETTTALRQFLTMAQILGHVDADTPIRLLIAECEQPQTVLAALYFAKLFGIDAKVDVSPLFETETAMEHGGRFLEALLAEPAYQAYVRTRGREALQTGLSDAGRFIGQVPAALAIERLQGRLARIMAGHGLGGVSALIFNTHGESMGRGAHPGSMADRLFYPMSAWARQQFASRQIALDMEVSFQGGDGYLFFRTDALALATLTRIAEVLANPRNNADPGEDPFYTQTDISLDFYRGIRRVQREHLDSKTYPRAVTAFGLGLLNETGSRKSRRQSDLKADGDMSLRQIRAIPHNAILQQLGYPVNVLAGVGSAAGADREALGDILSRSRRGQSLVRLLRAADRLASIKSVAAYGALFNSAYLASRPYRGKEDHLADACLSLAEHLTSDDRAGVFRRLASRLRIDGLKLHRLLDPIAAPDDKAGREDTRRSLGALHALRLALLQHIFLKAVQVPVFSRSNDVSRDDVLDMVLSLRIEDALAQLRSAFPVSAPNMADFSMTAPTDYPDGGDPAYARIQDDYIDPIERAYALVLRISTAIANHFGAHG